METRLTKLLGIQYPILQGGMAWVSEYKLAAAVSNAGGLGIIAAANAPVSWLSEQISCIKKLTAKPFGVNIMMLSPYVDEVAELLIKERVYVITTGAGNPKKYIDRWKSAGIKVIPVISSVAMALKMQACGADAVVAEGMESGGHIGKMTTMALLPQVADSVDIPIVAAGGIGDARGMAAAFMLGACGVQMGTRFVVTKECQAHQNYKAAILNAKDTDTLVTGSSIGKPVRAIINHITERYMELESSGASVDELENLVLGSLRKAAVCGDVCNGSVMAGQISGMIKCEVTCKELIEKLVWETENLIGGKSE